MYWLQGTGFWFPSTIGFVGLWYMKHYFIRCLFFSSFAPGVWVCPPRRFTRGWSVKLDQGIVGRPEQKRICHGYSYQLVNIDNYHLSRMTVRTFLKDKCSLKTWLFRYCWKKYTDQFVSTLSESRSTFNMIMNCPPWWKRGIEVIQVVGSHRCSTVGHFHLFYSQLSDSSFQIIIGRARKHIWQQRRLRHREGGNLNGSGCFEVLLAGPLRFPPPPHRTDTQFLNAGDRSGPSFWKLIITFVFIHLWLGIRKT